MLHPKTIDLKPKIVRSCEFLKSVAFFDNFTELENFWSTKIKNVVFFQFRELFFFQIKNKKSKANALKFLRKVFSLPLFDECHHLL